MKSHFLQRDYQGFLKDAEVQLIDKTQASDPTKREFYWATTLRTFYPDGLNNERTISSFFRPPHTFSLMLGSPSTRVLSSVPAIAFS